MLNRHVALSPSEDHAVVWWSASDQEVFPWAPNLREEDRANVMLFSLKGEDQTPRRLGFLRTHSNPVALRFAHAQPDIQVLPEVAAGTPPDCVLHYLGQRETRHGSHQQQQASARPTETKFFTETKISSLCVFAESTPFLLT